MNISKLIAGCVLLSSASLSAVELTSSIDLSGGYRQDDFKTGYHYIPSSGDDFINNVTQAQHVNIWQIGLKGLLVMPEIDCFCNYGFLRNFYVKGYGYWGSDAGHTHFDDDYSGRSTDGSDLDAFACGRVKNYTTSDWQIGAGYLFDLGCWCGYGSDLDLSLGISGGYSWSKQKFSLRHNGVDGGYSGVAFIPDASYNGAKLFNKWQGGWLGTEIFYSTCSLLLNLGYEYHWSTWHSGTNYPAADFWDRRHSDNASGNVVYLDATYELCHCWEVGAGLKWSRYTADKGHTSASDDATYTYRDANGRWQSWQLVANVGYRF